MLEIHADCVDYFKAVRARSDEVNLRKQFDNALCRLHLYADDWYGPHDVKVVLTKDCAPLSFTCTFLHLADGEWKPWFTGGLIYQGPDSPADGSGPSFTVSLGNPTEVGWFLHT